MRRDAATDRADIDMAVAPDLETALLDQLYTPVLVVDAGDRISRCNAAAEVLMGHAAPRLKGLPVAALEQLAPTILPLIQRCRTTQRRHIARDIALEAHEGVRRVDVLASAMGDEVLVEMPAIDPLRGPRDSVDRWHQAEALELMVQGLCHEIRNPLSGMRGAAQLLEQEMTTLGSDAELLVYTRLIQQEADRIAALVDQFSNRAQRPQLDPVNIHRLLDDAIALQRAGWGERPDVRKDYDPSIPEIMAERALLIQIILNLLNNAAQAQAEQIIVRTRIEHECPLPESGARTALAVHIEDDGVGVPSHLRDIIFLPMVSGRPDGTGLGLALAQQIARRHGGLLQYQERHAAEHSHGSVFRLLLPLQSAATGSAESRSQSSSGFSGGGE